ncbi:MAG: hypothetical protein RBS24_00450 [Bacilli bacterium]|nr:hypothetical protein [Bacilli bacterium]
MRSLKIINEYGQSIELTGKVLINGIEGLGITRENEYLAFRDRYSLARISHGLGDITLGLVFLEGYSGYKDFVLFISRAIKLFLEYKTNETYLCKIAFKEITKGEISFGSLQSNLTIVKLSPWYRNSEFALEVSTTESAKEFPYVYHYTYGANANGSMQITNSGDADAYLSLKIIGRMKNPYVIVNKNGETIGTFRLFYEGEDIVSMSSIPEDEYIKVADENAYQLQDFTCKNFLTIPKGESEIVFYPGTSDPATCYLRIEESFEGV